ncbi:MAG: hypothetical protein JXN59_14290 [Anaerolineae bacterium]|nr:hypothetical protein [Anaerolineae bacterium]
MRDILLFLTTSVIWAAYAGTVITSLLMGPDVGDWVIGLIVIVFGMVAAYATRKLWVPDSYELARGSEVQQFTKAKRNRQARLARLIEELDDDEMVELETLLATQDGELRL